MRKHLVLIFLLFLVVVRYDVYGQKGKKITYYTAAGKPKSKLQPKAARLGLEADSSFNTLIVYCPDKRGFSPCASASTLPPGIPKCNPATCLNNFLFIRESTGKYKMRFSINNKPFVLSLKTTNSSFEQSLSALSNTTFFHSK